MADKEINDLTDGGAVQDGDLVHVVRAGNSRKGALKAQLPATPASSSAPASLDLAEQTTNGTSKVTLKAPAALGGDREFILPDADVTLSAYIASLLNSTTAAGFRAAIGVREVLTADRTYYVRTDGSDSNDGLANTSGGAFLTIQHAVNVAATVDLAGNALTIQVADGTYSGAIALKSLVGGVATIRGNPTTPANVVITNSVGGALIKADGVSTAWTLDGLKLSHPSANGSLIACFNGSKLYLGAMDFGVVSGGVSYQVHAAGGGSSITFESNYTISGGSVRSHLRAESGGVITCNNRTVTLTGTPAFGTSSNAFAVADTNGTIWAQGNTYSGSATGARYYTRAAGVIYVAGGGASYFPGNAAGGGDGTGVYV